MMRAFKILALSTVLLCEYVLIRPCLSQPSLGENFYSESMTNVNARLALTATLTFC